MKRLASRAVVAAALAMLAACRSQQPASVPRSAAASAAYGGTIVASIRAEPRSFNRYNSRDRTSTIIAALTHASLVRIDRTSDRLEPDLAERWELLPDGRTYRLTLRHGLTFSDGQPFTAADVVFSFRAIYDPRAATVLADSLLVSGKPLVVAAEGDDVVTVRFPRPFGPGLRPLADVPMLPRHRLEAALEAGTFQSAWSLSTPPSELAGLGPFVLQHYEPGRQLLFDRNPHYWRRDESGRALPVADHMRLDVVSDQDVEQLKMVAGDLDFTQSELRPADYATLKRAEADGRVKLTELGVGLDGDMLWLNLSAAKSTDKRRAWLQHVDFRRAIASAVDRDLFVNTVFLGAGVPATGVVSPGNRPWFSDAKGTTFDLATAKTTLTALGLSDADGDGALADKGGAPVRFSLLTQKGNTSLERGAAVIRESLAKVGVQVDVVALEVGALIERFTKGDYDAVYFRLLTTDTDPALNLDFWLSSGSAHVWNPSQKAPATAWEQEIDALMTRVGEMSDQQERRALFADVQRIMLRELPALAFAFPKHWVAMSNRIAYATPSPVFPPLLWNPAVIALKQTSGP